MQGPGSLGMVISTSVHRCVYLIIYHFFYIQAAQI